MIQPAADAWPPFSALISVECSRSNGSRSQFDRLAVTNLSGDCMVHVRSTQPVIISPTGSRPFGCQGGHVN